MSTLTGKPYSPVKGNERANPAALRVARAIAERENPCFAILFGSQARGQQGPDSDVDILLVVERIPDEEEDEIAREKAARDAFEVWGKWVEVDLLWVEREEFRRKRQYDNSVETNAMREGTVMPRNPESYSRHDFEDEETEYRHDWATYEERLRHAEVHLEDFIFMSENNRNDISISQHAQKSLENGLKVLLRAGKAPYGKTHNIGHLLGSARYRGLLEPDFRLQIPPDVYTAYDEEEYDDKRNQPELTSYEDYTRKTAAAADVIIRKAKEVREENA